MPQIAMPATNKDGPIAAAPDAQLRFAASAVIAAIVVGAIYFGRPILVPIALAILLAFALAPIVSLLRHLRAGRVPSVIFATLAAIAIIGALVCSSDRSLPVSRRTCPATSTRSKTRSMPWRRLQLRTA